MDPAHRFFELGYMLKISHRAIVSFHNSLSSFNGSCLSFPMKLELGGDTERHLVWTPLVCLDGALRL